MVEKKTFFSCFFSKKRKALTIKKKIFPFLFYADNQTIIKSKNAYLTERY
jgi:hypothetical protein